MCREHDPVAMAKVGNMTWPVVKEGGRGTLAEPLLSNFETFLSDFESF